MRLSALGGDNRFLTEVFTLHPLRWLEYLLRNFAHR